MIGQFRCEASTLLLVDPPSSGNSRRRGERPSRKLSHSNGSNPPVEASMMPDSRPACRATLSPGLETAIDSVGVKLVVHVIVAVVALAACKLAVLVSLAAGKS